MHQKILCRIEAHDGISVSKILNVRKILNRNLKLGLLLYCKKILSINLLLLNAHIQRFVPDKLINGFSQHKIS